MKKTSLLAVAIILITQSSFAQWTNSGNDIYNTNSGDVSIGSNFTGAKFNVYNGNSWGTTPKSSYLLATFSSSCGTGNVLQNNLWLVRNTTGSDWYSTRLHDGISIDNSFTQPQINTRTWWERDPSNGIQSWGDGGNTYMTLMQGSLGIGTTSPGAKLHIVEDGATGATALKLTNRNSTQTFGLAVDVGAVDDAKLMIYNANNSTPNFVIDNTGKVGIGTTSPSQLFSVGSGSPFNVTSAGNVTAPSFTDGYNSFTLAQINRSGGNVELQYNTGSPVRIGGATSANLIVNGSGLFNSINIGTGAGVPLFYNSNSVPEFSAPLFQISSGNASNLSQAVVGLNLENTSATNNTYSPVISFSRLSNSGGYNCAYAEIAGLSTGIGNNGDANWVSGALTFLTAPTAGAAGSLERMRIDANGNVGIGTPSPEAAIHVNSNGSTSNATNQYSGDMIIQGNPGNRTSTTGASLEFVIPANSDGSNPWGQGRIITVAGIDNSTYNATGKMILGTRRSFDKGVGTGVTWNYGDDLVIDGSGNVAIGTTDPKGYKLAVAGTAIAEQMTVKLQANWPDYIFKKDYTLMPLSELKTYIDKNHHLPEIPSAADVEKDGLNLGEMNKLLVKKVEELTLYLIEKEKEIKDLKADKQAKDEQDKQQNDRLKKMEEQLDALLKSGK